MVTNDAVYTVAEAARLLRVSKPTLYEALRTGVVPCLRLGRRVLIPRAGLERLLAGEQASEPAEAAPAWGPRNERA